ncbi:MAG: tetraacyldisaccharide 4'-kinase [Alistipes sp.]|nr:tetraacyldisaccharide 4'-kinase [Alistipes sp.]
MRRILFTPAAWLYKMAVTFRHRLFDWGVLKSEKFDIPIVCIGNVTVGGTGKTPMAEMILGYMSRLHRVALLSRGYGRRTKGYVEVSLSSDYRNVGDEPLQIKMKFPDVVVVVCEKRAEAIRRIRAEHPEIDLIVMDDGFQHRYVEPKINIVMVDATQPVQNDSMLPAGRLRDIPEMLYRAHYFVVTKCPVDMKPIDRRVMHKVLVTMAYQKIYFTRFESFRPEPLYDEAPDNVDFGREVIALSGIGNPGPFIEEMKRRYNVVETVTFGDHHVYTRNDMRRLLQLCSDHPGAVIVTTEKDAVKMTRRSRVPAAICPKLYYIPINITFTEGSEADFLQKLEHDVRSN